MLTKDNTYKVMKLVFDSPERTFHIREMARLTGLSAPGVSKIIKRLKAEGLLTAERGKVVEEVSASRTDKFVLFKRCYNMQRLFESGLIGFLKDTYEEPEAIVLFGSYSKGEDTSVSDIDIAIITKKELRPDLRKFEAALKREINVHEIQIRSVDKEFLNTLANGTVLSGFLEAVQ